MLTTQNRTARVIDGSLWRDDVLNISYRVIGVDMLTAEALVVCQSGNRTWNDAMPLECFITELTEVK